MAVCIVEPRQFNGRRRQRRVLRRLRPTPCNADIDGGLRRCATRPHLVLDLTPSVDDDDKAATSATELVGTIIGTHLGMLALWPSPTEADPKLVIWVSP